MTASAPPRFGRVELRPVAISESERTARWAKVADLLRLERPVEQETATAAQAA